MSDDWIDVTEAWECIASRAPVLPVEDCPLERARGRVLAQRVMADRDTPPFDRAAMDGYAVRAHETLAARPDHPVRLRVLGEVRPGQAGPCPDSPNTSVRIMTGAAVPAGWDAIVPVEETNGFGADPVEVHRAASAGAHIVPRGRERQQGSVVYEPGRRIEAVDVGALAMLGVSLVRVHAQPRVAVLATGDELVSWRDTPGPLAIRNSNSPMLAALLEPLAAHVDLLGVAVDTRTALREQLQTGLQADVLCISGGVSAGAYDHVEDVLEELGVQLWFRKVAVQPGKPVCFGTRGARCVLALPGNPVSAWTTFRLFGVGLLLRMQGMQDVRPRFEWRTADFEWTRRNPKWILFAGSCRGDVVHRAPYAGSGDLLAFAAADGQVVLPPDVDAVQPGDRVLFWTRP